MVQHCIEFKEDPSQFSIGKTAQSLPCSIMEKPRTGWMNVQESYSPALEQGTLTHARDGCLRPRFSPIKPPPPQIKLSKGQCDSLCGPPLVLHAHESTIAGLLRRLSPLLSPSLGSNFIATDPLLIGGNSKGRIARDFGGRSEDFMS